MLLPIWMLWLFPQGWAIIIPGNLAIDCLVLFLTLCALKHTAKRAVLKELWWKFWALGFLADFVGVAWMFLGYLPVLFSNWNRVGEWWDHTLGYIMYDPFGHPVAFAWTLIAVALAGVCIYFFDKRAMKKCALLTDREKHIIALAMAVITAPWLFFIKVY